MKTNNPFLNLGFITTLLLQALSASASDGAGVRGGGEVVDVDGQYVMRDLKERAVFDCHSGTELMNENPLVFTILDKVKALDWYFADELKTEMGFLRFCFTGPLYPLDTHDRDLPVIPSPEISRFVAYRDHSKVLIDEQLFHDPKLSPRQRALLLVHETMHSYLPMNVDDGSITDPNVLHQKMIDNDIQFPTEVENLDAYQKQVEFALYISESDREKAILASQTLEELTVQPVSGYAKAKIAEALAPWDRDRVMNATYEILINDLRSILLHGSDTDFESILSKTYTNIDPLVIALSISNELTPSRFTELLNSPNYHGVFNRIYDNMAQAKISYSDFRVRASEDLIIKLGLSREDGTPITSLSSQDASKCLPIEANAIVERLIWLARKGQWQAIEDNVTENIAFYAAFGFEKQRSQISNLNIYVKREKPHAMDKLSDLSQTLIDRMLDKMADELDDDTFAKLKSMIHFNQF